MNRRDIKELREEVWVRLCGPASDLTDYQTRYRAKGRIETIQVEFDWSGGWDSRGICHEIQAQIQCELDRLGLSGTHENRVGLKVDCFHDLVIVRSGAALRVTLPIDISWW